MEIVVEAVEVNFLITYNYCICMTGSYIYTQIRRIYTINLKTMTKLYFQKHEESCYPLQYHIEYMKTYGLKTLEIFKAKRERCTDYFFCKKYDSISEKQNSCGRFCEGYKPRNGKAGICTHYGYVYEQTEKSVTLLNKTQL